MAVPGTLDSLSGRRHENEFEAAYTAAPRRWGDMFKAWILGPTKATRSALQNAASTAGIIVTAEGAVVEKPEDEEEPAGAGGHDDVH